MWAREKAWILMMKMLKPAACRIMLGEWRTDSSSSSDSQFPDDVLSFLCNGFHSQKENEKDTLQKRRLEREW